MFIGHKKQWDFLKIAADSGNLPHAILFSGPDKIGKRKVATELIKYINCSSKNNNEKPCQQCKNCQDIEKKTFPDFTYIEAAGSEIKMSQIRELSRNLSLKPYSSSIKTAVIDKAHLMNQEAQSCFLKLLEEPRGRALIILITEYPEILLGTITSRAQKIRFFPPEKLQVQKFIESQDIKEDKAREILSLCFGKPGKAAELIFNPEKVKWQKKTISDFLKIFDADLSSRFSFSKKITEEDSESKEGILKETLELWLNYLRKMLFLKLLTSEKNGKNADFISKYSLGKIKKGIKITQSAISLISSTNANPRIIMDALLMEL